MNNNVYTQFYNIVLNQINEIYPTKNKELIEKLQKNNKLKKLVLENNIDRTKILNEINQIILNLIDDEMIRATVTPVKIYGYLFNIEGLTTKGHEYLSAINTSKVWQKIKKSLHDEGIPLTPRMAFKQFSKLFF